MMVTFASNQALQPTATRCAFTFFMIKTVQDAPGDAHLARISLFNHMIFGLGIALWMAVMRPI
jgi:hypothetical protein